MTVNRSQSRPRRLHLSKGPELPYLPTVTAFTAPRGMARQGMNGQQALVGGTWRAPSFVAEVRRLREMVLGREATSGR
jgi:hypothetical protein